jgi:hypothetical protein
MFTCCFPKKAAPSGPLIEQLKALPGRINVSYVRVGNKHVFHLEYNGEDSLFLSKVKGNIAYLKYNYTTGMKTMSGTFGNIAIPVNITEFVIEINYNTTEPVWHS